MSHTTDDLPRHERRRRMYMNGITPAVAKRICKFWFGDAFREFNANPDAETYDVYIDPDKLEDPDTHISIFDEYWGPGYRYVHPVTFQPLYG